MLIDTDNKIVLFNANTALTLDDLWQLIDILDPFDMDEPEDTPEPAPDGWVSQDDIVHVFLVQSSTSHTVYSVVLFADASYACSCPDWIHRRSKQPYNDPCKHILRVHVSLLS